jgi:hypothetical protein
MQEVFVQFRLDHSARVVRLDKVLEAHAVFLGVRHQQMDEVSRLRLWRHAPALGAISRETSYRVKARLSGPDTVIFLDSGKNGVPQELPRIRIVLDTLIHPQSHIGQEWRLRAGQVVGAIRVENLAVVLDLKAKVDDHALGKINAIAHEETQGLHVAIPSVELVETASRHHERDTSVFILPGCVVVLLGHCQCQQSRLLLELHDIVRSDIGIKHHHIEA